jgi:hypothetical protein
MTNELKEDLLQEKSEPNSLRGFYQEGASHREKAKQIKERAKG